MAHDYQYRAPHNPPMWDDSRKRRFLNYLRHGMNKKEIATAMGINYNTCEAMFQEFVALKIWCPKTKRLIGTLPPSPR